MTINRSNKSVTIEVDGNKTIEITTKITECIEIDENEMFEIKEYPYGVWVVAPKGAPMPEHVCIIDHHNGERFEMEPNYEDSDIYHDEYNYSISYDKQEAIEDAYDYWCWKNGE